MNQGESLMRFNLLSGLIAIALCFAIQTPAHAARHDADGYPLRVHIMKITAQPRNSRNGKHLSDSPDYVDGMGVGDLFENGQPQALQFSYSCIDGLKSSSGYGTFPARWKKKDKTLEILQPETGKPENLESCDLHTELMPGTAFYWKSGSLSQEPATVLKAWMVKHQYDPEKDRNDPVLAAGETPGPDGEITEDPQLAGP
jgi:hypothetical protein